MDEPQKSKNKNKTKQENHYMKFKKPDTKNRCRRSLLMEVQGQAKLIYGDRTVVITSGRRSTKYK